MPPSLPNCPASADAAPDLSEIMTAQMLLELAIGEVEADAKRNQHSRQTVDAPSIQSAQGTEPAHEPRMASNAAVHSRDFAPRRFSPN